MRWCIVWAGVLFAVMTLADTWMPPRTVTVHSPSETFIAQVVPGDSGNPANYDQAITNRAHNASARVSARQLNGTSHLLWEGKLVNPVAPADVYVSDAGNLVTLDNWYHVGYGAVVVLYDLKGHLRRYWKLKELLALEQTLDLISASSINWRTGEPRFGEGTLTNTLIVPTADGEFVFDVADGRLLSALPGHPRPAKTGEDNLVFRSGPSPVSPGSERATYGQLSVTADGERICIVTPSAGAAFFDAGTGTRLDHLGANSLEGVFVPDGRWFVQAADKRAPVSTRAILTGERLSQLVEAAPPPAPKMATLAATQFESRFRTGGLLLREDGRLLAAPATNGVVVFDLAKTQIVARFEFPDARALPVAFTPDGKALLGGRAPNEALAELKLMRLADGTVLCSIPRPNSGWVGRRVGIGHYNENGGHDEVIGSRYRVCELARFNSHADLLALVQADPVREGCLVELWEVPTGSLKFRRSLPCLPTQAGFVANSRTLAVTGFVTSNTNSVRDLVLLNGRDGKVRQSFHLDVGGGTGQRSMVFNGWNGGAFEMGALFGCLDFAVSPNGKLLAVASMDTFIHLIDLDRAVETTTFRGHATGVIRVAFHPSGQRLYSLDTTGEVRAWPVGDPPKRENPKKSQ